MTKDKKKSLAYKNINFIKLLVDYRKKPRQFKKVIKQSTDEEVNAITEIIYNFLQGHLKCNKNKFKRQATFLRLVRNKKNLKLRREAILSKGGSLLSLLTLAIPTLVLLFGK